MTDTTGALYDLFSATFFQPPGRPDAFDALVESGLATAAAHGKITGYRISPAGYAKATALWGHDQRETLP